MFKKVIPIFILLSFGFGQEKLPDISVKLLSGKTTNLYDSRIMPNFGKDSNITATIPT